VILEIVIDNKIKKKHYLKSADDFYIDWILSSYDHKTASVLKEEIRGLLIQLFLKSEEDTKTKSVETLVIINDFLYHIKCTKWSKDEADVYSDEHNNNNSLPSSLYDDLKERAYRMFKLYANRDQY